MLMKKHLVWWIVALGWAVLPAVVNAAEAPTKEVAAAVDVSGTWDCVVETSQGSGTPVFTFKQDGAKLTGTYKGQFGEAPVTGTLKGNAIAFSVTVNVGEDLKIEYTGSVDGVAMKGTAKFGSDAEGTFTARKRVK